MSDLLRFWKILILFAVLVVAVTAGYLILPGKPPDRVEDTMGVSIKVEIYSPPKLPYDWMSHILPKGVEEDPVKHRYVKYRVTLENLGKRAKYNVLFEMFEYPSFSAITIGSVTDSGWVFQKLQAGRYNKINRGAYYLLEGDPQEIERLAYENKVRVAWEEGGRKYEKVVSP